MTPSHPSLFRRAAYLALAFVLLAGASFASAAQPVTVPAEVARVIDGDSLKLSDGREVRLIGIDTPEFKDQKRNARTARRLGVDKKRYVAYADAARRFAVEQVFRGSPPPVRVELEFDDANAAVQHRDKYGRLLAYVWLPGQDEPVSLNALMVSEGYTATYPYFPFKYSEDYKKLENEAHAGRKGIWNTSAN